MPKRQAVLAALSKVRFQGVAYPRPVVWDEKGDNLSAVTALNVVDGGEFREVAEFPRSGC
ncbi:hypothetical protein LRP30_29490 [Bradyrhizobium sp. C-145]|uniref:hypothetical protein n=1 Tax=Bradyrhizobium sp. C-145 TaxID=574727 RepID=UPI00201B5474|nr:hypothetical protein [Bradyrhizobium sp. C-145]UQR61084.1 hypothetical protein LRP30_29490 [Bradyrhizobium sp. C-145]